VSSVVGSRSLFRYYGPALQHRVDTFEREVERQLEIPHAVATSSGTAALIAALAALPVYRTYVDDGGRSSEQDRAVLDAIVAALGIGPGDEVVCPAVTFIATANAVVAAGAVPVFCEVDRSLGVDPAALDAVITSRTAAVMPVHLENVVCEMDGVLEVARRHELAVVEDACQAIGASYRGVAAGGLGDIGAFSLQLEKNITAGEGGVLVTRDEALAQRAARFTDQGGQFVTARGGTRGLADLAFTGQNLRMTELTGAVAGVQLTRLPGIIADMRANKAKLLAMLGSIDGLEPRQVPDPEGDGGSSVGWFAPDAQTASRFAAALVAEGVPAGRVYDGLPVYANPAYQERRTVTDRSPWSSHPVDVRYDLGSCPVSEDLVARAVIVLVGPDYTAADLEDVATAVHKVARAML
jgi:8-amino-3,8-dideoxy-alpha-D-manno-octulosonate transaminase